MSGPQDPRRIALIGVRTGSGESGATTGSAQAIVVGEVPVIDGVIVDPAANPTFTWEWRYALFDLDDLERLFANASREYAKNTPWAQIPHPLGGPHAFTEDFYKPEYYDSFGPGAQLLLDKDEKADLISPAELSAGVITKLQEPIHPYIDDAGTTSPAPVSRLNFTIPLRDVVRLAIYDRDVQPFGPPAADGPLIALDTCRFIDPKGSPDPQRPSAPNSDPPGTRIVVFTDPMAIAKYGPDKNKQSSATGKLLGFAVLGEVRLPLNGHDGTDNRQRGFVRLFAVRTGTVRDKNSIFARVATSSTTPSLGPLFDNMWVGYTLGHQNPRYFRNPKRNASLSELADVRTSDPGFGSPGANHVPILDALNIGFTSDSVMRTIGFRLIDESRMVLRFEAVYFITDDSDLKVPFAPRLGLGPRNIRFAQEQPSLAVNWVLSPSQQTRWIFTARNFELDYDNDATITDKVIQAYNAKVDQLHRSLREVQDATPISLLPILSLNEGDKKNGKPGADPVARRFGKCANFARVAFCRLACRSKAVSPNDCCADRENPSDSP